MAFLSVTKSKVFPTLKGVVENAPERITKNPYFSKAAETQGNDVQHKFTGRLELGSQYHYTMETQVALCVPIEDGMDIYSATQWIDATQMAIADVLNVPNSLLNMHVRRLGGGYGGKISRSIQVACAAALAAHKLNRPVRFVMQLEANMNIIGKRYACINDYEIEIDGNGKIQKLVSDYVEDYGCSKNEPGKKIFTLLNTKKKLHLFSSVLMGTGEFINNCYDNKYFTLNAKEAITNSPANTWCRAPGTLEGIAMIENVMEHIAMKVNKDPVEVRMENIPSDSDMRKHLEEFVKSTGKLV